MDERDERPGWKFSEWEMRGVPLRLEIGPKDIEKSQVLLARRDTREKLGVPMDGLAPRMLELLNDVQRTLFARALAFREEHTQQADNYDAFKQALDGRPGFVLAPVVRIGRLRGAHQDRHPGHDPEHPDERAEPPTARACGCDSAGAIRRAVREVLLAAGGAEQGQARAGCSGGKSAPSLFDLPSSPRAVV